MWLNLDNEEFNLSKNLLIGCTTTFAHDFFITPADGKLFHLNAILLPYKDV